MAICKTKYVYSNGNNNRCKMRQLDIILKMEQPNIHVMKLNHLYNHVLLLINIQTTKNDNNLTAVPGIVWRVGGCVPRLLCRISGGCVSRVFCLVFGVVVGGGGLIFCGVAGGIFCDKFNICECVQMSDLQVNITIYHLFSYLINIC